MRLLSGLLVLVPWAGLLVAQMDGQAAARSMPAEERKQLTETVLYALGWYDFWVSHLSVDGRLDGKFVRLQDRQLVLLSELGLRLDLEGAEAGKIGRLSFIGVLSYRARESNEAALAEYLFMHRGNCGQGQADVEAVDTPSGRQGPLGRTLPLARIERCEEAAVVLEEVDFTVEVPRIHPPEYVEDDKDPAIPLETIRAIQQAVQELGSWNEFVRVTIPRFSVNDFQVFVLIETPDEVGVQRVRRYGSDEWSLELFTPDSPKNNITPLIERIRRLRMVEYNVRVR